MPATMQTPSQCDFPNGNSASLHTIDAIAQLPSLIETLKLDTPRPVLVIVGGASKISPEDLDRLALLFTEVVAPVADRLQAIVVDGGTDSGVMKLIGQARAAIGATFPLIGVSAIGTVSYPGMVCENEDAATLEPNHSHFILVPGSNWGDESQWIAETARVISGATPSCTIVVNGGEITWKDVAQSVEDNRQTIVLEGSGRAADELAAELNDEPADDRAAPLVASGLLQAIDIDHDPQALETLLEKLLVVDPIATPSV
jgi:hypothetical protein